MAELVSEILIPEVNSSGASSGDRRAQANIDETEQPGKIRDHDPNRNAETPDAREVTIAAKEQELHDLEQRLRLDASRLAEDQNLVEGQREQIAIANAEVQSQREAVVNEKKTADALIVQERLRVDEQAKTAETGSAAVQKSRQELSEETRLLAERENEFHQRELKFN